MNPFDRSLSIHWRRTPRLFGSRLSSPGSFSSVTFTVLPGNILSRSRRYFSAAQGPRCWLNAQWKTTLGAFRNRLERPGTELSLVNWFVESCNLGSLVNWLVENCSLGSRFVDWFVTNCSLGSRFVDWFVNNCTQGSRFVDRFVEKCSLGSRFVIGLWVGLWKTLGSMMGHAGTI